MLITFGDILCVASFLTALLLVLVMPPRETTFPRSARIALAVGMGLYMFVGLSNLLEWLGVTAYFDMYEDYAEMLFLPLIAYSVYTLSMARQIGAARRAENAIRSEHALLTAIVDTTPTGILVVTRDGILTYANDPARDLLGITDDEDTGRLALDRDVRIGGQRADWTEVREAFSDMVTGPPLRDAIRFAMLGDGSTVALSVSTNRLGGDDSEGAVLAIQDITERMRYRQDLEQTVSERTEELLELNRRLGAANDAKRDFLAKMSHELRTPLNSVIGFTGILIDGMAGPLTEEQLKQLTMVRRAGRQLLDIVSDVIDIARIEAGKASVVVQPVEVCAFLAEIGQVMQHAADERSIELTIDCPPDIGVIETDPGKLGQVIRNLVVNAIQFSDPGGKVRVSADADGDTVTISVSDTGIGIAQDRIEEAFTAFTQIETPDRMQPHGAGLGLAVARDLVTLLGGRIEVDSVVGSGTTFAVCLPVSAPE